MAGLIRDLDGHWVYGKAAALSGCLVITSLGEPWMCDQNSILA